MVLGITGGIGTGKSTVLGYLKERYGAILISCDDVARQLQQPDEECYEPMRELLLNGQDRREQERRTQNDPDPAARQEDAVLNADGSFNRSEIARRVFADEELRIKLNRIVHPAVKRRVRELIEAHRDAPLIVIEAALLLEDNYGEVCDEIWYVRADEAVRRERLKKNRGYTDEKIVAILSSQRSDESYRALCALTIDNSSENIENTFRQLDKALQSRNVYPAAPAGRTLRRPAPDEA